MSSHDASVLEMVQRRRRRRRGRIVSLAAIGVLAAAVVIGLVVVRTSASVPDQAPTRVPAGATGDKEGLLIASGTVRVDFYFDYLCPECRIAEPALTPALGALQARHEITLVYHPIDLLRDFSRPRGYSTRAASAAACAADQGKIVRYSSVLFDRQPPERGPGLSTGQLIAAGRDAGITSASFAACVRGRVYDPWVRYVSQTAYSHDIASTPTVRVDGRNVDVGGADPGAALTRAVVAARSRR